MSATGVRKTPADQTFVIDAAEAGISATRVVEDSRAARWRKKDGMAAVGIAHRPDHLPIVVNAEKGDICRAGNSDRIDKGAIGFTAKAGLGDLDGASAVRANDLAKVVDILRNVIKRARYLENIGPAGSDDEGAIRNDGDATEGSYVVQVVHDCLLRADANICEGLTGQEEAAGIVPQEIEATNGPRVVDAGEDGIPLLPFRIENRCAELTVASPSKATGVTRSVSVKPGNVAVVVDARQRGICAAGIVDSSEDLEAGGSSQER